MAEQRNVDLPDGTDTIIEPAEPQNSGAIATDRVAEDEGGATSTIPDSPRVVSPTASAAAASSFRTRPARKPADWSAKASSAPRKRSPMSPG